MNTLVVDLHQPGNPSQRGCKIDYEPGDPAETIIKQILDGIEWQAEKIDWERPYCVVFFHGESSGADRNVQIGVHRPTSRSASLP